MPRGEELDRVTGQATGQEGRNEWEWKQTKAGAERKAGKEKEKWAVFHSCHFSGIRTDTPYGGVLLKVRIGRYL